MIRPVIFVNRCTDGNLGDALSSPLNYFRAAFAFNMHIEVHLRGTRYERHVRKRVLQRLRDAAHLIIVGGGGLLGHEFYRDDIRFWTDGYRTPVVLWGAGHNVGSIFTVPESTEEVGYAQLLGFTAIGLRDWGTDFPWVPCASCLHPALHDTETSRQLLLFALHRDTRRDVTFLERLLKQASGPYEVVFNDERVERYIGKMRSASAVVTNSYHGAYWATLLGKPVVAVGGGTKMLLMKHKPTIATVDDWAARMSYAVGHPNVLEECCDRTVDFSRMIARNYTRNGITGRSRARGR